jgi:hypothetical protein
MRASAIMKYETWAKLLWPMNVRVPNPTPRAPEPSAPDGQPARPITIARIRRFFRDNGKKLWWLHSAYALGLGLFVVAFAQKGFEHARWLAVTLGITWLLVIVLFRVFGSGRARALETAGSKARIRFYALTYVLKNLYQGMLFFLLPFYWKSTTWGAPNAWFVALLAVCAVMSTLDIVFDRFLMKRREIASVFHAITLFGCLNLVVPALFPNTRTMYSLLVAAGITAVGVWTLNVEAKTIKKRLTIALAAASVLGAVGLSYVARTAIPPVPMYVSYEAVGPAVLPEPDGRLTMEVKSLHKSVITQLLAVTDVVVPGGHGDRLHHVWRHDGADVRRATEKTSSVHGPEGTIRLRSSLQGGDLPSNLVGSWTVDVETEDGQLVGRARFTVTE